MDLKFCANFSKVFLVLGMLESASLSYHISAKLAPCPSLILFRVVVTFPSLEE